MTEQQHADLSAQNIQAWDTLYGNTPETRVWGEAPIGFLPAFMHHVRPHIQTGDRILDAGAGEGRNLDVLLDTPGDVYACDASQNALNKLAERLQGRICCVRCVLSELPFEPDFFRFVLLSDVMETLPEPGPVLREIYRVLLPGGMFLCNIPGHEDNIADIDMTPLEREGYLYQDQYYYKFRGEAEAVRLLEKSGFDVVVNELFSWKEEPHPGYRDREHEHTSRIFLVRKRR